MHHRKERRIRFKIVVVDLPDKAGLGRITHPCDDAGGRVEELRVAAFIHGAEGLKVCQLSLADKVGEVGDSAVAAGNDSRVLIAALCSARQIMLGPIVVD